MNILKHCKVCNQMTKHNERGCLKCQINLDKWGESLMDLVNMTNTSLGNVVKIIGIHFNDHSTLSKEEFGEIIMKAHKLMLSDRK